MLKGYLIAGVFAIVALGALWWTVDRHGYNRGRAEERAAWQARESAELAKANQLIGQLQREARTKERQHAEALSTISSRYQKELTDAKRKHTVDLANIRAGRLRLRDPAAAAGESACPGRSGETPTGAGGRDGPPGSDLSRTAAEFLYGLAAEADEIVHQLTACQDVVRQDRETPL